VSALSTVYGIVARDLRRSSRQSGRLLGGVARPLMWLLLVGTGYEAIAHLAGGLSYRAFVLPGIVVMAALFGGMLTAIATVYDREFGMLRLMLASPAGVPVILAGRAGAATLIALAQGAIVLACAPLVIPLSPVQIVGATGALALTSAMSACLGLLVAARLRSVENFAGVINIILFPLLFASGALYPTRGMPPTLRVLAHVNPVTYAVDLMRHAMGQPAELAAVGDTVVVVGVAIVAFTLTALRFDPEARLLGRNATPRA
jgi:ABC-2 type transport system permease protein